MLCSLFSIFDPVCSILFFSGHFKWFMVLLFMLFVNWNYNLTFSGFMLFINILFNLIKDLLKLSFENRYKGVSIMIISIFMMLLIVGEFGMSPYVFTSSSHLAFNLSMSLPMWMGGFIYMFTLNWKSAISHFVPLGCPFILIPFLVVVETLSNFIRPFSLSIRLMSNIMAGHIIVVLLSSIISLLFGNILFLILIVLQSMLLMFEVGVALVQSYVFMSLVSLYWKENLMD
nr:ATP synthase F0 subunit 6 [Halipeurus diversus]